MSNRQKLNKLILELLSLPKKEIADNIRHFYLSIEIFHINFTELINLIDLHNNNQDKLVELIEARQVGPIHPFQIETSRLLHNYISSAVSLSEHARNHFRELYGSNNSFVDYQSQIDIYFKNHPLSNFIKDFRQYIQHFELPGLTSRFVLDRKTGNSEMSLLISKESILKFSGWKSSSKKYIDSLDDSLNLENILNEYNNHVMEFYCWFIQRQIELQRELSEPNKKF